MVEFGSTLQDLGKDARYAPAGPFGHLSWITLAVKQSLTYTSGVDSAALHGSVDTPHPLSDAHIQ